MFKTPSPKAANPFMDASQMTMAKLIAVINGDADLEEARRSNVASSIRRFCKALGYDPAEVPANFWYFRQKLTRFDPASAKIKKERWGTLKADVGFALDRAGFGKKQARGFAALSCGWLELKKLVAAPYLYWGLARLATFCSARGIEPHAVADATIAAFKMAIEQETFKTKPDRMVREVCVLWNKAAERYPQLGLQRLMVPSNLKNCTSPWEALPLPFRRDADAWLAAMAKEADLLSEEGPIKPLRPDTIVTYRYVLRQAHAGLVGKGVAPETIDCLDVLARPENAKLILAFHLERTGGKPSSMLHNIAHVLVLIAKTRGHADDVAVEKLKRFRMQLAPRRNGLCPRPKNGLRQFTCDTGNIEKILCLPLKIWNKLKRKANLDIHDARLMLIAVALELLLMRPVRRKNIVELRLDENVIRVGAKAFIRLPSDQVKNSVELDYRLPAETVAMLNFYIEKILPLFGPNPKRWLFPGQDPDRPICKDHFSTQFREVIGELTGLYFTPHLTRHFGALLYLNENPGSFEVVRLVLAHRSLTTTMRSYVSFENDAAVRMYDEVILRIRDAIKREIGDD